MFNLLVHCCSSPSLTHIFSYGSKKMCDMIKIVSLRLIYLLTSHVVCYIIRNYYNKLPEVEKSRGVLGSVKHFLLQKLFEIEDEKNLTK